MEKYMYALVETSGTQMRVAEGDEIIVDRITEEKGSTLSLSTVLFISGDDAKIGTPYVEGAVVEAEVMDHILGDKVDTFKYRRARRYRKRKGNRRRDTHARTD